MSADPAAFRFVSTNRRVREDRRFVAGHGRFVADVALDDEDRCIDIALGVGGIGDRPLRLDRKSTRLNSSHVTTSRMPSSA